MKKLKDENSNLNISILLGILTAIIISSVKFHTNQIIGDVFIIIAVMMLSLEYNAYKKIKIV